MIYAVLYVGLFLASLLVACQLLEAKRYNSYTTVPGFSLNFLFAIHSCVVLIFSFHQALKGYIIVNVRNQSTVKIVSFHSQGC